VRASAIKLRAGRSLFLGAACVGIGMASGGPALAQTPESFGLLDVNGTSGRIAPAFPGTKAVWAGTCDLADAGTTDGVGAAPAVRPHCIDFGTVPTPSAPPNLWESGLEPSWRLDPVGQAGAHPDATASFYFKPKPASDPGAIFRLDGNAKDIRVKLPPGTVGNPQAVPLCPEHASQQIPPACPAETQVGMATLQLSGFGTRTQPVYAVEPRDGITAEFVIGNVAGLYNVPVTARVRAKDGYAVEALALKIPTSAPLIGQTLTFWGTPWAAEHDKYRVRPNYFNSQTQDMPEEGLAPEDQIHYDPSWGDIRPFFTNPTECTGRLLETTFKADSWQHPAEAENDDDPRWITHNAPTDIPVGGCADVDFVPSIELNPTVSQADSPTGLDVELEIPQSNDLPFDSPPLNATQAEVDQYVADATAYWDSKDGLATSHLKDTVVTLPEGMTINPSGANGLEACTDGQLGLGNDEPAGCPDASKIGTVTAVSPVLEDAIAGHVFIRSQNSSDPESGEMFRLAIVLHDPRQGVLVKLPGQVRANAATGRLETTFANNPQLPVERISLRFKGGPQAPLATPPTCGPKTMEARLSSWSGHVVGLSDSFTVDCPGMAGFSPAFMAGTANAVAGAVSPFGLRIERPDGQEFIDGVTVELPPGLIAKLRGVPLCSNADANAGACSLGSRIGTAIVGAGPGASPFYTKPEHGSVYLTEGYKGGPYGLSVVVRAIAGPFDLGTVVVRQAIYVDPVDAHLTVVSDPLPTILKGVPLRLRSINVDIDRPGFVINPTSCAEKQIRTTLQSQQGSVTSLSSRFQVGGCEALPFRPRLGFRLTGRKQMRDKRHPGLRSVLTQRSGQAGMRRVAVKLPLSLALDPERAQSDSLCEFEDGRKVEPACPRSSIIGRAKAFTPVLNRRLEGPVYFTKNVRIHPRTGNRIRTLPTLVIPLRGEVAINLRGATSVERGRLVTTFATVPDAPVSRFELSLVGGRRGILVTNGNLCRRPRGQIAALESDGHNGKRFDSNVRMKTACATKKRVTCRTKKQKRTRACKQRAQTRRAARRRASGRR
jgi:hypothetical protein